MVSFFPGKSYPNDFLSSRSVVLDIGADKNQRQGETSENNLFHDPRHHEGRGKALILFEDGVKTQATSRKESRFSTR